MLCDRFVNWRSHPKARRTDGWAAMYEGAAVKIVNAVRYNLSDELLPVLVDLARERPRRLREALAFARVPHRTTWIEYAFAPMRQYHDALGTDRDGRTNVADPIRVGLLIEAKDDHAASLIAHVAWEQLDQPPDIAAAAIRFDALTPFDAGPSEDQVRSDWPTLYSSIHPPSDENIKAIVEQSRHVQCVPAPLWARRRQLMATRGNKMGSWFYEEGVKDARSEIGVLLSALIMMNTVNGLHISPVDLSQLNRARASQRKPPLLGYSTAHFRLSRTERRAIGSMVTGTTKAWHLCRGHFKQKAQRDGSVRLFWWREHWRGDRSRLRVKPPIIHVSGPAAIAH